MITPMILEEHRMSPTPLSNSSSPESKNKTAPLLRKGPSRKYFHSLGPTFSITPPTTQLQFLDDTDPVKNTIVRKKAREWVKHNRDRESASQKMDKPPKERNDEMAVTWTMIANPLGGPCAGRVNPFDVLPSVGRNVDHIIEYFLTACPEEAPCAGDKDSQIPSNSGLQLYHRNSIIANMSQEYVSFVLWLYAASIIRDFLTGEGLSEDAVWFYKLSLQVMQEASKRKVTEYTEAFFSSMACFASASWFSGMFAAATWHRDAMLKALALKGCGDLSVGLRHCSSWTRNAIQWSEMDVAAQNREYSQIPYIPPPFKALPHSIAYKADRLATITTSNLPPISRIFDDVFRWLHQVVLSAGGYPSSPIGAIPGRMRTDDVTIRPLYDVEYTLLHMVASQGTGDHVYSELEVLLTECCHLFLLIGPRGLPVKVRMCDISSVWLKHHMVRLLDHIQSTRDTHSPFLSPLELNPIPCDNLEVPTKDVDRNERKLETAILWGLYLGTVIAGTGPRPEYPWFRRHFQSQLESMGLKSKSDIHQVLKIFPHSEKYAWFGLQKLDVEFED